jgi:hypothetical protein
MEKVFGWIPASAGMTDFSASDGKLAHYRSPSLVLYFQDVDRS